MSPEPGRFEAFYASALQHPIGLWIAAGAAIGNIPLVHRLDQNPLEVIRTGDFVRIDADKGIVEVTKKEGGGPEG